jgi:hypothetical protein
MSVAFCWPGSALPLHAVTHNTCAMSSMRAKADKCMFVCWEVCSLQMQVLTCAAALLCVSHAGWCLPPTVSCCWPVGSAGPSARQCLQAAFQSRCSYGTGKGPPSARLLRCHWLRTYPSPSTAAGQVRGWAAVCAIPGLQCATPMLAAYFHSLLAAVALPAAARAWVLWQCMCCIAESARVPAHAAADVCCCCCCCQAPGV